LSQSGSWDNGPEHDTSSRQGNVADGQVNPGAQGRARRPEPRHCQRLRERVDKIAAHHGAATKVVEVPPGPPVLSTLVAEV